MKRTIKDALFAKHVLVAETPGENQIETMYSFMKELNIRIIEGVENANIKVLECASEMIGRYIPDPFFRYFPESVRSMNSDALLMDQLIHYTVTYGFENFSEAGRSLLEKAHERSDFNEEDEPKEFRILNEADAIVEAKKLQQAYCESTRPLSDVQMQFVIDVMTEYDCIPDNIASKDTACELLRLTKDIRFAKYLQLHDLIRLVDAINWNGHHSEKLNKLHLTNQERKFVSKVLDKLLEESISYNEVTACVEKRDTWKGLLHQIHYCPKTKNGQYTISAIYNEDIRSAYSKFEKLMKTDPVHAAKYLKLAKGSAAVLRNLNSIMSKTDDVKEVLDTVDAKNPVVLIQMQQAYRNYDEGPRFFRFTKHGRIHAHRELVRSSILPKEKRDSAIEALETKLRDSIAGKVGKVYIAPGMENIAVPINMSAGESGLGIMPTGSRIDLPEGKKIRAFTYWEKVNDIDLACFGVNADNSRNEFSWRTMWDRQSEAVTYSGDQTSGYNGGSEYFDIDIDRIHMMYPEMKYLVFTNNVYSGVNFNEVICRAGWMSRDIIDSGEVYEPKTVRSAYTINAKTTFCYLFAIDIDKRQVIWLNVADSDSVRVAGSAEFDWLYDYFNICETMNMRKLFTYAATEVVDKPEDADLVIGDVRTDREQIHSYEFEKALAYLS